MRTLAALALYRAIVVSLFATLWMSAAHACDPPEVGDQFQFPKGPILQVVKVTSPTCSNVKLCIRPVGSKQPCRWIKEPSGASGATWIFSHGVNQTIVPECDPSVGFTAGCKPKE
jgi:hypothetical protein